MLIGNLGLSQDLIDAVKAITEASCSAKKMEKEELHPNQVKLDKNKNGKLDADDFKKLRKEDAEQIDELKTSTLTSYVKKAGADLHKSDQKTKKEFNKYGDSGNDKHLDAGEKSHARFTKRLGGITTASNKLNKKLRDADLGEEVEQIDELSKGTLANYTQKAAHDVGNKMYHAGLTHGIANVKNSEGSTDLGNYYDKTAKASHSKALDRLQGIKKAADKIARQDIRKEEFTLEDYSLEEIQDFMMSEDFEQLDELSKKTLGSYVKKATDDYTNRETRISRALDNSSKMFLDPNINKAAVKQANRKLGMNKAIDKLTKEQVEEIEMLAAKHGLGE